MKVYELGMLVRDSKGRVAEDVNWVDIKANNEIEALRKALNRCYKDGLLVRSIECTNVKEV